MAHRVVGFDHRLSLLHFAKGNPMTDFQYSAAPQRSPEWFELRRGKVTASRLEDWMAVSKAAKTLGAPLKKRLDYEKELMFERQFQTSFQKWVSTAMQDGIDFEAFGRQQFEQIMGKVILECGAWYNDVFCASPDGTVGDDGLAEVKILKDNSFLEVIAADPETTHNGVPEKHWKQIQGQLWASGKARCWYIAVNFNTRKVAIIEVLPDAEFHQWLELIVQEQLVQTEFNLDSIHDIKGELPDGALMLDVNEPGDTPKKGWAD
jgi:predicted phage-related endonuclease